jgi:hypothetical protein
VGPYIITCLYFCQSGTPHWPTDLASHVVTEGLPVSPYIITPLLISAALKLYVIMQCASVLTPTTSALYIHYNASSWLLSRHPCCGHIIMRDLHFCRSGTLHYTLHFLCIIMPHCSLFLITHVLMHGSHYISIRSTDMFPHFNALHCMSCCHECKCGFCNKIYSTLHSQLAAKSSSLPSTSSSMLSIVNPAASSRSFRWLSNTCAAHWRTAAQAFDHNMSLRRSAAAFSVA